MTTQPRARFDENSEDSRLNSQARFANQTGMCPICRVREIKHGITCGDWACMNHFLPGGDKTLPIDKNR